MRKEIKKKKMELLNYFRKRPESLKMLHEFIKDLYLKLWWGGNKNSPLPIHAGQEYGTRILALKLQKLHCVPSNIS